MDAELLVRRLRERADPARSPALAGLLDRVAVRLGAALSDLLGAPVSATRAASADWEGPWLRARFRLTAKSAMGNVLWEAGAAAALSRGDLHLLTDLLFGGDGGEPLQPGRPVSALERHVATAVLARAADAVRDAFAPHLALHVAADGLEEAQTRAAGLHSFRFNCGARTGSIALDLPPQALAALGEARPERPPAPPAADPAWAQDLRGEVGRAPVTVQGVLEEGGFTLADLAALRVGSVLTLQAGAQSPVLLSAQGRALFGGRLGQSSGAYTIRIEGPAHEAPLRPFEAAEHPNG